MKAWGATLGYRIKLQFVEQALNTTTVLKVYQ